MNDSSQLHELRAGPNDLRPDPCPPKTRADLEWDRVLAALADRCAGPLGRKLAMDLPFAATRPEARAFLSQSAEATRLLRDGAPLPVGQVDDVRDALERARIGGVLAPTDLRAVGRMLAAARGLRRFLSARRAGIPALFEACATDPSLDELADEIARSFEPDGTLADSASPRLRALRSEWYAARQRTLSRMEDLMSRYEAVLQDRFVTEREGRWVLPIRSDAHERFPGIVHATSASGATLFIEPRAVVALGNRLKVLEADVKREEEAVYAQLTALVNEALPSTEAAARALALADVRAATAKLASDVELVFPDVVDEPRLDLKRARHILLALELPQVVPSDLVLQAGRAMVVSGPNAGGKTVALKTMGLAALLARAGLPIPCGEGSTIGLFDVVLTDVGDDQSLQRSLSTFSAHVSNLAAILQQTTRGSLVLLDELAGGTDPREGEALAAGLLDSFCARGGAVAATTHYEGLKALALADERFLNASVGFDLATMAPTFELAMGVPGSSSALAVARRFGMPSTVLERAERFLTREDRTFEAVVKRLHDERAALELARAAADEREHEAERLRVQLQAQLAAMASRERRTLSDEAGELMNRLRRAREELRAAQARLRAKRVEPGALVEAERAIDRVAHEVAVGGGLEPLVVKMDEAAREPVEVTELRKGMRVWVPRLRASAEVVDLLSGGQVRVAAGALKLTLGAAELRAVTAAQTSALRPTSREASRRAAHRTEEIPVQVRETTCDLRGLRVDDAIAMATSFLDRALGEGAQAVFLLHGHGTGALRDALRKELARMPYVSRFQAGDGDRGGEGVTIAWLS
ncbi:MAG: Smr/MutS family protein [Myxococcota bacterium]|nr:Smr/MutS family protein [Myxococcota bacterium]